MTHAHDPAPTPELSTFLSSLVPSLLTREQARTLYSEGMREPGSFTVVTAADLRSVLPGLRLHDAGQIIATAAAARTARDDDGANDVALRVHLADATSHDERRATAAIDALEARGVRVVPLDPQGVVAVETAVFFLSLPHAVADAAVSAGVYDGYALRRLADLRPKVYVPASPTSREPLQSGADWRTGVRWGDLPRLDLGLAAWAVDNKLTGGAADDALHADFAAHGPKYRNADNIRRARGVTDAQLEALAEAGATSVKPVSDPAPPVDGSTPSDLYGLLRVLFDADELRRFVRFLPSGSTLAAELPGGNTPMAQLAWDAADLLQRQGFTRLEDFWARLEQERPRRVADIRRVRAGGR